MGREGFEPSKLSLPHFECGAFTYFAIYPIIKTATLLYYNNTQFNFIYFV